MRENALIELSHAWDRQMTMNDANAIGAFMSHDWMIVRPDGRETPL